MRFATELNPAEIFRLTSADYQAQQHLKKQLLRVLPGWVDRLQTNKDINDGTYRRASTEEKSRIWLSGDTNYHHSPYSNVLPDYHRDYLAALHGVRLLLAELVSTDLDVQIASDDSPDHFFKSPKLRESIKYSINPAVIQWKTDLEKLVEAAIELDVIDSTRETELIAVAATRLLIMEPCHSVLGATIINHYARKLQSDKAVACLLGAAEQHVYKRDEVREKTYSHIALAKETLSDLLRKLKIDPSDYNLLRALRLLYQSQSEATGADKVLRFCLEKLLGKHIYLICCDNVLYHVVCGDVSETRVPDLQMSYSIAHEQDPILFDMYRRLFERSQSLADRVTDNIEPPI